MPVINDNNLLHILIIDQQFSKCYHFVATSIKSPCATMRSARLRCSLRIRKVSCVVCTQGLLPSFVPTCISTKIRAQTLLPWWTCRFRKTHFMVSLLCHHKLGGSNLTFFFIFKVTQIGLRFGAVLSYRSYSLMRVKIVYTNNKGPLWTEKRLVQAFSPARNHP